MNEPVKDNDMNTSVGTNSTTHEHLGAEENKSKNNPIPAADKSRNEERDQRVREEQDTERLRSERQSVQEKKPE